MNILLVNLDALGGRNDEEKSCVVDFSFGKLFVRSDFFRIYCYATNKKKKCIPESVEIRQRQGHLVSRVCIIGL